MYLRKSAFLIIAVIWFILFVIRSLPRESTTGGPTAYKYFNKHTNGKSAISKSLAKTICIYNKCSEFDVLFRGIANGQGEMGQPVRLPLYMNISTWRALVQGYRSHAFNNYASDIISVRRKLPDYRDRWCQQPNRILKELPQTSVIICFHNEAWSVLLRNVHSILDRSPAHLLKEIILVDDFSDMPHLMEPLDIYMSYLPKVKIVRSVRRLGLIRGKLLGVQQATAPVLTFLDSHCECTQGWLEPLLDRIARNRTTVVCPLITQIDDNNFQFREDQTDVMSVGGFTWNLAFDWHLLPEREQVTRVHNAAPVASPTMAGGLFAIDKEFFEHIGTYDDELDFWGGENLELSFKTWMCGGRLEIVPCSIVGHIFRNISPHRLSSKFKPGTWNLARVAEVWLDDYAKYFYETIGEEKVDFGNVSSRRALRQKLGCKSFDWYVENVYPDLTIPSECIARGEIYNPLTDLCLDCGQNPDNPIFPLIGYSCHGYKNNQYWMYTKLGEIRLNELCLDHLPNTTKPFLNRCHLKRGSQLWFYDLDSLHLYNSVTTDCLTINATSNIIGMDMCDAPDQSQVWRLEDLGVDKLLREFAT